MNGLLNTLKIVCKMSVYILKFVVVAQNWLVNVQGVVL
jgi:hypothetical protein